MPDNSYYYGEVKYGTDIPHGRGVRVYLSKNNGPRIREAWFCDGKASSFGRSIWACGDVFHGYFVNDVPNGWGQLVLANGETYGGIFKDGELNVDQVR